VPFFDERTIPRAHAPSPSAFERFFRRPARPVIVTGWMDDWPATEGWSLQAFGERFGARALTSIPTRDGKALYSPESGVPYQVTTAAAYASAAARGDPGSYLVLKVDEQLPELIEDVRPPPPFVAASWRRSRFWMAPPDVGGALHRDLPDNLYAQVRGHKRWLLLEPHVTRHLGPHPPWSATPNYAQADAEREGDPRFAGLRGLPRWSVVLAPGEMLYIPRRWWHQARSIDSSVSINFWWAVGPTLALVRAAEAFQRLRGLRL
jgi:lysine-specific demethylase 8